MTKRPISRAFSVTILTLALCLLGLNWSSAAIGDQDKPAEQVYKNIQVFNGLPASELDGAM